MLVLNDIHIGVNRKGGTTPGSAAALKAYLQEQFRQAVMTYSGHLVIAGDLFDQFEVDYVDVIQVYQTLADYLLGADDLRLTLIRGNHDASAKGDKVSSFEFLATVLLSQFPKQVQVVNGEFAHVAGCVYAIGHCNNQDLFELELAKAFDQFGGNSDQYIPDGRILILHCNLDNKFAEVADHSLNLTAEWAKKFDDVTVRILLAHEHQHRTVKNVRVMGNQWPSSINDCQEHDGAQHDGRKVCHFVNDVNGEIEAEQTWTATGSFRRIGWRDLFDEDLSKYQFIRIQGNAVAAEAAEVISAISKFRSKSNAFVVANAVKIEGMPDMEELGELQFNDVKKFDVLGELMKLLEEPERMVIKRLLAVEEAT